MKVTLIIENGKTKAILRPENDFEADTIEKVFDNRYKYNISAEFVAKSDIAGYYKDHSIEINITENENKKN